MKASINKLFLVGLLLSCCVILPAKANICGDVWGQCMADCGPSSPTWCRELCDSDLVAICCDEILPSENEKCNNLANPLMEKCADDDVDCQEWYNQKGLGCCLIQ